MLTLALLIILHEYKRINIDLYFDLINFLVDKKDAIFCVTYTVREWPTVRYFDFLLFLGVKFLLATKYFVTNITGVAISDYGDTV